MSVWIQGFPVAGLTATFMSHIMIEPFSLLLKDEFQWIWKWRIHLYFLKHVCLVADFDPEPILFSPYPTSIMRLFFIFFILLVTTLLFYLPISMCCYLSIKHDCKLNVKTWTASHLLHIKNREISSQI